MFRLNRLPSAAATSRLMTIQTRGTLALVTVTSVEKKTHAQKEKALQPPPHASPAPSFTRRRGGPCFGSSIKYSTKLVSAAVSIAWISTPWVLGRTGGPPRRNFAEQGTRQDIFPRVDIRNEERLKPGPLRIFRSLWMDTRRWIIK